MTKSNRKYNMGGWLRLYNDVIDDPKVQQLSGEQFKAWINLLCLASKHNGEIPPLKDVAFRLRMDIDHVESLIEKLVSEGLLEYSPKTKILSPYNWQNRQPKRDKSRDRMRRLRARKKAEKKPAKNTSDGDVRICDASQDGNVPTSTSSSEFILNTEYPITTYPSSIYQGNGVSSRKDRKGDVGDVLTAMWEGRS